MAPDLLSPKPIFDTHRQLGEGEWVLPCREVGPARTRRRQTVPYSPGRSVDVRTRSSFGGAVRFQRQSAGVATGCRLRGCAAPPGERKYMKRIVFKV